MEMTVGKGSVLGRSAKSGRLIRLKDPERSTYVIGAHGTGKSTLLLNLILAEIERDDKGLVVLDPHGDLVRAVTRLCPPGHAHRLVYFAPAAQQHRVLGLNPFEIEDRKEYELKTGALMDVFAHTWYGSFSKTPTLQNTLETLVRTLLAAYQVHYTNFLHMLLLTRLDSTGDFWRETLSRFVADNPALTQNWAEWADSRRLQVDIESSRQKIKHIIASDVLFPVLCQPTSAACFHFQEVLAGNGVLLVNLEGLEDEGQRLVGSIILNQLLVMARLREQAVDRVPCHIYADEFYKFSPQSFVAIINEARKYRIFCTLAHQNLAQLDRPAEAAAANCGNIIVFRVNPIDSGTLSRHFLAGGRPLPANYLANLPRYHAMVRYADRKHRRQAQIRTHRERGEESAATTALILAQSEEYGRTREEIEHYRDVILGVKDGTKEPEKRPRIRRKAEDAGDQPAE
jgi:hypothetical protein